MDPASAILLGGGISTAGSLLSTGFNIGNQRDYWQRQERLQSTAYQRAVKDMRAAGLNPLMMYGGSGVRPADSSMGSPAPIAQGDMLHGIGEGISSASRYRLEQQRVQLERDLTQAQVEKARADAEAAKANAAKTVYEVQTYLPTSLDRVRSGVLLDKANADYSQASAAGARADLPRKRAQGKAGGVLEEVLDDWFKPDSRSTGRIWKEDVIDPAKRWLHGKWKSLMDFFADGEGNANGGASSAESYKRAQDNMYRGKGR